MSVLLKVLGIIFIVAGIWSGLYFLSLRTSDVDRILGKAGPLPNEILNTLAAGSFVSGLYSACLAFALAKLLEQSEVIERRLLELMRLSEAQAEKLRAMDNAG